MKLNKKSAFISALAIVLSMQATSLSVSADGAQFMNPEYEITNPEEFFPEEENDHIIHCRDDETGEYYNLVFKDDNVYYVVHNVDGEEYERGQEILNGIFDNDDEDDYHDYYYDSFREELDRLEAEKNENSYRTDDGKWVNPLGQVENNGKVYDYTFSGPFGGYYICYSKDERINASLTSATVRPGGMTYIDITLSGATDVSTFMSQIDFNEDVFSLEAVSSNSDKVNPEELIYSLNTKRFLYLCSMDNGQLSTNLTGDNSFRLAFKVKDDAPDGEYKIGLSNVMNGDLSGFVRTEMNEAEDTFMVYVPVTYESGTIKVSREEAPKTNLQPKPLKRVYGQVSGKTMKSAVTGDVNADGTIDAADALKTKMHLLGVTDVPVNADSNEDGSVNVLDYIVLKDYLIAD